jgi:hypothetical protein
MLASDGPSRHVCARVFCLILMLPALSTFSLGQYSFMMHFAPAGLGASIANRGDFNNDGIPDVITGNNGGSSGDAVSVYLGRGDGRFQKNKDSGSGVASFDMAIGDFNSDGRLDVAVAGYSSSTQGVLQILLGKGDGTFSVGQKIILSTIPDCIATADFNGDGKLDLAVGRDKVYLYKGVGNGTFTSAVSIAVGTNSSLQQVRVGDFNADGKVDLAVSDGLILYVLWNNGNFSFSKVKLVSTEYGVGITPVDVNQDHFTDLLVVYYTCEIGKDTPAGACTNWEVLLGNVNKTFKRSANVHLDSTHQGLWGATAADINGDGINDIVGITQTSELIIWPGNSDSSYQSTPVEFPIGSNSSASDLVASDFNRDGKLDFAIPTPGITSSAGLSILLNATPRAPCTPKTASPAVTVCEPQDVIYENSPVKWIAESRDMSHAVTAMQVYVDHKLIVDSPSSSINENLRLPKGPHLVITKAWDSSGGNFQSDRTITIYSGTRGETCSTSESSLNVCLPTQNQMTSTSLHVFANSASPAQITAMQVYIDGRLIYNDTSGATYVDTAIAVSKGTHSVVVKAWDANGNTFRQARTITAQ